MSPNSASQKQGHGDFRHWREDRVGIYVLKEPVGAGYFAEVWRALDTSMNREVALKIFYDDIISRPDVAKAILREAETQGRIQSDRVTPIFACHLSHDSGPGPYYIAMRLMPGGTLDDLLERESRLSVPRAIAIVKDVLEGLKAAHEADIVHRDLKPNNVLFDSHGHAALADFGIAKDLRAQGRGRSVFGRPGIGTPHYMSPEQHLGTDVTKAWDIYSVGVLLYEMLSGAPPFNAPSDTAMFKAKTERPVPPLRNIVPVIPARLELVIERCLDPDVGSRYPDCEALERALDWALETPRNVGQNPVVEEQVTNEARGESEPPPQPGTPPRQTARSANEQVGNYQLVRLLGINATSEMWQAVDLLKRQNVALRIFTGDGWRDRRREALESQARINSAGVVPIYEIHLDSSAPFYAASKLMPGGSLATLLRNRSRLQLAEALTIIRQAIRGLYAAHSAGLVHGGISANNILLDSDGGAALADFGMRQTHLDHNLQPGAGMAVYMSPEELFGEPPAISSDIYSLGVVLYEMLVGHPPSEGTTVDQIRRSKLAPVPSFGIAAGIPERLEKVIACCLSENLEHRYPDCSALTRALDWATGPMSPPPPPAAATEPPRFAPPPIPKRGVNWGWLAVAGLILVAIIIAIVASQGGH
jgi:serine/threonine protein kinase